MPGFAFYRTAKWRKLARKIKLRDGYRCVICGFNGRGKRWSLRVDHINDLRRNPGLAYAEWNLRTLCNACDAARHSEKGGNQVERDRIGADGYPVGTEWADG